MHASHSFDTLEAENVLMQSFLEEVGTVLDEISAHGKTHPDSIALMHGTKRLSYSELDRRSGQFANHLATFGIGAGHTVAISMERSFDWIVAALGVMRAGGAYVPLDTAWPDARLRSAVEDSGATVLVARTGLLDRLDVKAIGIDPTRDSAAIAASPESSRGPIQPKNLAYVIYTSGSTGVPKGVEITHANLRKLLDWHVSAFNVTSGDRASHLVGLGFDAAVLEIWPHLFAGATVVLAEEEVRSSADLIQDWMIRERVTIGIVPAVHGARLIAQPWPATTSLRHLIIGGEALHHGPIAQLPFEVTNEYGPTECTVVSTSALLKSHVAGPPPLGLPIAGASVYLLDEHGNPVANGQVGEIYIGGSLVARGYRNLPDLTERCFLADPFSSVTGARMYRTGDRGARRPDGQIEFRGRLDRQTKIRGHRIELDEIVSVLSQHSRVEFATVVSIGSQSGGNQLVAYVLPRGNVALPLPTVQELQTHLQQSLPDYMVPAIFVRLETLPLTPNGKLDLSLLPNPAQAQLLSRTPYNSPTSPTEAKLLTMMRELLANDRVTADDSFFLAGGHSLLGMQLVVRLRQAFGVNVSLRDLLEAPTVAKLALLVETLVGQRSELLQNPTVRQQVRLTHSSSKLEPILPAGILALQPKGNRNNIFWLHYHVPELAKSIGEEQPMLYATLTADDFPTLGKNPTLQRIASCLRDKMLAAQPTGPYTIAGYCLGGILAYEIASQLRSLGHEVSLVVLVDSQNPAYVQPRGTFRRRITYLHYFLKRLTRVGLKVGLGDLRKDLNGRFGGQPAPSSSRSELQLVQDLIENALPAYRPENYQGDVLLILASDRASYFDYLPGWQAVVPRTLHVEYIEAHHRDLLNAENVSKVANIILSQLEPKVRDRSLISGPAPGASKYSVALPLART
jgi:amino acid adenylation domain-containing protein